MHLVHSALPEIVRAAAAAVVTRFRQVDAFAGAERALQR